MKKSETKITTIIGKDAVLEGDFTANGSVRLDCVVEGNVKVSGHVIVGTTGKINGNVDAMSAVIGGEINGNVAADERVELTSSAKVIGDIATSTIVIDEKAIFQGKCDMKQEENKTRRRPARETRAGKKSAKDALKAALQEMQSETEGFGDENAAAAAVVQEDTKTEV